MPVSEQVYRVYQHYERKEEYFSYDLKTEKFQKDTATFLPSREDSYERLLEKDQQFAAPGKSVEQLAAEHLEAEQVRFCLSKLSKDEQELILQLFYQEKTEQEVGNMLQDAFLKKRKQKRQFPIKGNWRRKIHDNTDIPTMIVPVEVHNVSGQNSGFF